MKAYVPNKPAVCLESGPTENNLISAILDADIILILVERIQFKALNPEEITRYTHAGLVIDIVGAIDLTSWQNAGLDVLKLSVPKI